MPTPVPPNPLTVSISQSIAISRSATPVQGLGDATMTTSTAVPSSVGEGATGGLVDHTDINLSLIESSQEVNIKSLLCLYMVFNGCESNFEVNIFQFSNVTTNETFTLPVSSKIMSVKLLVIVIIVFKPYPGTYCLMPGSCYI